MLKAPELELAAHQADQPLTIGVPPADANQLEETPTASPEPAKEDDVVPLPFDSNDADGGFLGPFGPAHCSPASGGCCSQNLGFET